MLSTSGPSGDTSPTPVTTTRRAKLLPEKIVDDMIKISNEGYAGSALTFVNYNYELPFFCDRVLPLMKQAGLRVV